MRYSTELRHRMYIKGYEFLSFAKNLSNKYGKKLSAKKSTTDAIKTASKKAIQNRAEATGGLTGNKIADKITTAFKKLTKELQNDEASNEIEQGKASPKDVGVSPKERQQSNN